MDRWLLRLVQLFNPLFTRQGIDVSRMYIIVETKLLMDRRRPKSTWKQKQAKESTNHMLVTQLGYLVLGVFIAFAIVKIPSFLLAMIVAHAYVLFMMAITLVTDFSAVLLDTADNLIILPKPVNSKTMFMARLIHILLYILQFSISLTLVPLVATFYFYGPVTGITILITFYLTILLAVFLTYLLYLLVLRFSNEEKVKEVVTYFQIAVAVFFMVGFQVLPRLIHFNDISATFDLSWYSYLFPPVWMASVVNAIYLHQFGWLFWLMLLLSFAVPLISFYILTNRLAPSFSRKLGLMNQDAPASTVPQKRRDSMTAWPERAARIICTRPLEKNGFEIAWKITGRDKQFRLQFYPAMAYMIVFIFLFALNGGTNLAASWAALPGTQKYLWFIYVPLYSIANGIVLLRYNEDYQSAWIYYSSPVSKPGELISGSAKALFVKYFLPAYLIMFIFSLYIWGWSIAPQFVYGLLNNFLSFLIMNIATKHALPFSLKPGLRETTGKFIFILIEGLVIAALVGLHYLLIKYPLLLFVVMPIVAATCWLLLRELQDLPWKKISS